MSIFRCRWQRRLDWRAGRKFSGNCWSGVNYAWCDLRFQPPAKIGRSQRSVKVGFDTLSWASHPSESGNSPLKAGLSLHLLAGHHEIIGLDLSPLAAATTTIAEFPDSTTVPMYEPVDCQISGPRRRRGL